MFFFWSSSAVFEGAAEEAEGTLVQSTPLLLLATPVQPEAGDTASCGLFGVLLPEYHIYQRCSLSPK